MHHSDFIAILASIKNIDVYVELGLDKGDTFKKVLPYAQKCYGVDMKPNDHLTKLAQVDKVVLNYCSTDKFFETFDKKIDMCFIDADHYFESALRDFENAFKLLNDDGMILMHDVDPIHNNYINPVLCGDSYKIVPILEARNDLNIITLPLTEAGLAIIMKKDSSRTFLRNGIGIY